MGRLWIYILKSRQKSHLFFGLLNQFLCNDKNLFSIKNANKINYVEKQKVIKNMRWRRNRSRYTILIEMLDADQTIHCALYSICNSECDARICSKNLRKAILLEWCYRIDWHKRSRLLRLYFHDEWLVAYCSYYDYCWFWRFLCKNLLRKVC